ncbi:hypothetical protein BIFANG_03778 [Bifidobacterium angulatum DSM 20098 = JCM 7096]|uniref:Uncharacterized protein n=1 Tax=Bifidobacterium angulatum DSM 20098 = JCM 7096 TaxID=518635 RepID=C4FHE2_9BIFI|nr:hypothetical protein BIFANG_03778 [Bifidobacterium angulatum DSM 20098 = JCM 7096]
MIRYWTNFAAKETKALIASDEDPTRLFAGKSMQYRKSKSLPKFTGEAMRTCARSSASSSTIRTRLTACSTSSFPMRGGHAVHSAVQRRLRHRIDHRPWYVPQQGFHGVRRWIRDTWRRCQCAVFEVG